VDPCLAPLKLFLTLSILLIWLQSHGVSPPLRQRHTRLVSPLPVVCAGERRNDMWDATT
jgi:hypothetical protein